MQHEKKLDELIAQRQDDINQFFTIAGFFLLICGGLLIIKNLSKEDREQKRNQLFYNDIYEIVQKEIEKRSNYTYLI